MNENVKKCAICGKPIKDFWDTFHFRNHDVYACTECLKLTIGELEMYLSPTDLSSDSDLPDDETSGVFETTATVLDAVAEDLII